jgi:hypothetical protein
MGFSLQLKKTELAREHIEQNSLHLIIDSRWRSWLTLTRAYVDASEGFFAGDPKAISIRFTGCKVRGSKQASVGANIG